MNNEFISSQVLQADRRSLPNRSKEPTGEAESLAGRSIPKFGDRAQASITEEKEKARKKKLERAEKMKKSGAERNQKKSSLQTGYGFSNILAATDDFEGLQYRPRTKETKETYELILSFVSRKFGDISQEVLRGAVDAILIILKDEAVKDFDKKREIERLFSGTLSSDQFNQLVQLGKRIVDFKSDQDDQDNMDVDDFDNRAADYGVAVEFAEEDEEDSGDEYEIQDDIEEDSFNIQTEAADNEDDNEDFGFSSIQKSKEEESDLAVNPKDIDAFWVQRFITQYYPDPQTAQSKTAEVLSILSSTSNIGSCENSLQELFDFSNFDLVKLLLKNRHVIIVCTRLSKAGSQDEKEFIKKQALADGFGWILEKLEATESIAQKGRGRGRGEAVIENAMDLDEPESISQDTNFLAPKTSIDLESLIFQQGGHLMTNKNVKLPIGSTKKTKKGYEEVHVPPPPPIESKEKLIPITDLPEWAQKGFANAKSLNRIQSTVYPVAFESDQNMLLCAPTGAGKTNCAMLTMLRLIGKYINKETGVVDLDSFKIVYIAPMKALVAEMVGNFSKRLEKFGITVNELTGDRQLNKAQIAETQIIVTTPEKWDIITRKATDRSYTNLVRLVIIDEIHLLHDERGPVLESIVCRSLRNCEQTQQSCRLIGLSATLPNYDDVAKFLRVEKKGLFFFNNSYRPCPLKQQYIGITEKKALKRFQVMNDITYEKVMAEAGTNQILIFVHSRKETVKSAKIVRDMAIEKETLGQFFKTGGKSKGILEGMAEETTNEDLKDLLPYGFGIHHAGMSRKDRTMVEDLFAEGHIQVLCSTATLAWGVNLPAHTVIIRGTQVYNPEKGKWTELSPQDVLQMLGRAGRPQYDTFGEGIIITTHSELQYYLSLLNIQLPIESQYISKLADNLNAEIVLGTIRSREDAVDWLGYTYLYIRMRKNPALYGVSPEELQEDPYLRQKRVDIIHAAAIVLDKCNMIKYDKKTGKFQGTEVGRIASHYYISHQSMATYNKHLKPTMTQIDLFRVFALSEEFRFIPVRDEEKLELLKLLERVPIPIKESIDEPTAKINTLLQTYISQLKLEGFALMADMVFVTQSAGRILRAIFEICLRRGWSQLARRCLALCQMVDKRMWLSMNPLRQFKAVPQDVIQKLERMEFPWERYSELSPQELGVMAGMPKAGKTIHKFVHQFPMLDVVVHVQPISRSLLKVDLTITPDFQYDEKVSGASEAFWVLVEDVDSETILFHDYFVLRQKYSEDPHYLSFTVQLFDPLPPNYFVSLISDRWLHCETRKVISFKHLVLPDKYPPHTELLDLQPKLTSSFGNNEIEAVYKKVDVKQFNTIQTQVFSSLYGSDENVFVGAPAGCGKTLCAEFALLRLWKVTPEARCVYISPFEDVLAVKMADWRARFGKLFGGKNIVSLTGESAADLKILETADVVFSTPQKWDMLSRQWKRRKNVQTLGLFIADEVHLIGGDIGPAYEVILSRMRYITVQTESKIRIVALGTSLANAKDLGEWIGVSPQSIFNFHPSVRPIPLEIHIQGYNVPHFPSLMIAMTKPTYLALTQLAENKPTIVFVPSRSQCRSISRELLILCAADGQTDRFLHAAEGDIKALIDDVEDTNLGEVLKHGIGYIHESVSASDRVIVEKLFKSGAIQILIASKDTCWGLTVKANLVVLMGTQYYEGKEHRYVDYPITHVLEMMGRACKPIGGETGRCVLMCQSVKKEFYKKFLYEALPVESHLDSHLHDHFNAEIGTKTIENKQDAVDYLTWTFYYRRLVLNPNYYNLQLDDSTQREQLLSDHLSELIESTLEDLANSKCISMEEDDVEPLNLGMIASYYYINYGTMELFSNSLTAKTKLRGLLEIVSASIEFADVPIRHHEEGILQRIYERLPVRIVDPKFNDPRIKTNILLQCHFSRIQLPADLEFDQKLILGKVIPLIQACVDVISSNGWLSPALASMELCQMSVQGIWDKDSPLRQIPHITMDILSTLKTSMVETILDMLEMEDDDRKNALSTLSEAKLSDVARYVNRYPNVEVNYEMDKESVQQRKTISLKVSLEREIEDDEEVSPVIAPFYPRMKDEGWWVVVGDPKTKTLLAIKRTTLQKIATLKLQFSPPADVVGKVDLKMYLMCDSYAGLDQEFDLSIEVIASEESDEEEEDE